MQLTRLLGQGGARTLSACRAHSDHRNTRTHTGRPIGRTQERLFKEHAFQIPSDRYKKSPLILTTHGEVRLQLDRGASLSPLWSSATNGKRLRTSARDPRLLLVTSRGRGREREGRRAKSSRLDGGEDDHHGL